MAKATINSVHSASYAQLSTLLTQIAGNIAFEKGNITSAYKALIGELGKTAGDNPVDHTVVSYIAAKIAEVNGAADALENRVEANEAAITLLNNTADTVGSVKYMIAQEFDAFVTKETSDNIINTFKEMVNYLSTHPTEYANLALLVGTLPEGCQQTTVVAYAKALADAAEAAAKSYADGLAVNYDAAGTAQGLINGLAGEKSGSNNGVSVTVKTSKGEVSEVSVTAPDFANTYDAKGSASAVQGETENTVKDLEDAINGFSYLTDAEMNALKALFPTSAE